MEGRTYRYFRGEPLYPFGFGLSYTKFSYGNLKLDADRVRAGAGVRVSADVRNVGDRAGDEVVQLYLTDAASSVRVPVRSLAGFERVTLRPGERRRVTFTLTPEQMTVVDDRGRRLIEPGEFLVSVGGGQPGFKGRDAAATSEVVTGRFNVTGRVTLVP